MQRLVNSKKVKLFVGKKTRRKAWIKSATRGLVTFRNSWWLIPDSQSNFAFKVRQICACTKYSRRLARTREGCSKIYRANLLLPFVHAQLCFNLMAKFDCELGIRNYLWKLFSYNSYRGRYCAGALPYHTCRRTSDTLCRTVPLLHQMSLQQPITWPNSLTMSETSIYYIPSPY